MGNAATIAIRGENAQLKSALNDSESLLTKFGGKVKAAMAGIAAAFVIKEGFQLGKFFVDAASEAADSEAKLVQAIKAPGYAAGFTAEQLGAMADRLQDITKFEGDATKESQALLTSFQNVRGDIFVDATEAAMNMATVFGTDLNGEILKLGKALNNPKDGLMALGKAGIQFTDGQKAAIEAMIDAGDVAGAQGLILKELDNRFGGAAEAAGKTFSGQMEIAKNKLGDVAETVGGFLIPVLEELMPAFDGIITGLQNMAPAIKYVLDYWIDFGKGAVEAARVLFDYVKEGGLHAFTAFQMTLVNFGAIAEKIFLQFQYFGVQAFENIAHWLTKELPEYAAWFGRNWSNIFTDIATFQGTVLMNMGKNLKDFFIQVVKWLKGEGFDFRFTALTEGFQSTVEELPVIAERIPTALENSLHSQIEVINQRLSKEYDMLLKQNRDALDKLFTGKKKEIEVGVNTAVKVDAIQFQDEKKETKVKVKEEKETTEKVSRDVKETTKEKDTGETSAKFEGLEAANKRIQEAAASLTGKDDKQNELIDSNDELANAVDGLTEAIETDPLLNISAEKLKATFKPRDIMDKSERKTDAELLASAAPMPNLPPIPVKMTDLELLTKGMNTKPVGPAPMTDMDLLMSTFTGYTKRWKDDLELLTGKQGGLSTEQWDDVFGGSERGEGVENSFDPDAKDKKSLLGQGLGVGIEAFEVAIGEAARVLENTAEAMNSIAMNTNTSHVTMNPILEGLFVKLLETQTQIASLLAATSGDGKEGNAHLRKVADTIQNVGALY